jgi:hypothetical protein
VSVLFSTCNSAIPRLSFDFDRKEKADFSSLNPLIFTIKTPGDILYGFLDFSFQKEVGLKASQCCT